MQKLLNLGHFQTYEVNYEVSYEKLNGRDYIVVPTIMMVSGVHNGSSGPKLHLQDNFYRDIRAWHDIPVSIDHPTNNGEFVSVNENGSGVVGLVRNPYVQSGALRAEIWFEKDRLQRTSPAVYSAILERRAIDVSIGSRSRVEDRSGYWNGEAYDGVVLDYEPDHLAVLPDTDGACSWEDGCGIRVNQEDGVKDENKLIWLEKVVRTGNLWQVDRIRSQIIVNKEGFVTLAKMAQAYLDTMDRPGVMYFLEEIYEDSLIYRVSMEGQHSYSYYKSDYGVENGSFTLNGNPTQVNKSVDYLQDEAQVMRKNASGKTEWAKIDYDVDSKTLENNGGGLDMPEQGCNCGGDTATSASIFAGAGLTEDELEKVKLVDKDVLDKIVANKIKEKASEAKSITDLGTITVNTLEMPVKKEEEKAKEDDKAKPSVEEALETLKEAGDDVIFKLLPKDVQKQINKGLQAHQELRSRLITYLDEHKQTVYNKERLEAMDTEQLEEAAKLLEIDKEVKEESVNYFGLGAHTPKIEEEEVPPMDLPGTEKEEK